VVAIRRTTARWFVGLSAAPISALAREAARSRCCGCVCVTAVDERVAHPAPAPVDRDSTLSGYQHTGEVGAAGRAADTGILSPGGSFGPSAATALSRINYCIRLRSTAHPCRYQKPE
jgi:hypothetical protein